MPPSERRRRYITVHPEAPPVHRPPRCRPKGHPRHGPSMDPMVGAGGWGYSTGCHDAYARGRWLLAVNAAVLRPVPERRVLLRVSVAVDAFDLPVIDGAMR